MIGVLDFGSAGNVRSVQNGFARAGERTVLVRSASEIRKKRLAGLVIPGVGSFSTVPKIAAALGGREGIAGLKMPVLCICLGMQALFDSSEESKKNVGLGIIQGKVRKLRGNVRLPQLGWNKVSQTERGRQDPLLEGIEEGEYFYFANSFAAFPDDPAAVLGTVKYGEKFATVVRARNFWGVQFHPEKSGKAGQRLIENFAAICRKTRVEK
ncbi:MAG: imidazole glycerol phosphate synthase subunit HisH [Candidatus Micrarchaeota archaeon]|nr:imidazole glycerol phosphate synthase subunit HisH [Candidatus Micrarchaeota archaeon]